MPVCPSELTQLRGEASVGGAPPLAGQGQPAVDCECIVEVFELLWRWSNASTNSESFFERFGFMIPESIIILQNRIYAWYFVSKKTGQLLRKKASNLTPTNVRDRLCQPRVIGTQGEVAAVWYPMRSQFDDERSQKRKALFLTPATCASLLTQVGPPLPTGGASEQEGGSSSSGVATGGDSGGTGLGGTRGAGALSGLLQRMVLPNGRCNFLIRALQYHGRLSLAVRTNRMTFVPERYVREIVGGVS